MVRRGSKRRDLKDVTTESPTHAAMESGKARTASPRRGRGLTPPAVNRDRSPMLRKRRSKRYIMANPWTDGSDAARPDAPGKNDDFLSATQHSRIQEVPEHWTTVSGKFDPKRSEMGFDAKSNMAINFNSSCDNSGETVSNDSEESPSNTGQKGKSKKSESAAPILEGEIVDPAERHYFYKKLKKAGIKKTLTIDEDWETSSTSSSISGISVGNASYILDLAQQKESRKKDREEEALEEALELYGTWLTEGKNDDKNIFLMILHEVKKEQKSKYKKADKRHATFLDAALDDELKRREQVKQEEEEEEEKQKVAEAAATAAALKKKSEVLPVPDSGITSKSRHKNNLLSFYSKQNESKISEIILSQRFLNSDPHDKDSSLEGSDQCPEEWLEPSEPFESTELEPNKPNSKRSRKPRLFRRFKSKDKDAATDPASQSDPAIYSRNSDHSQKEDLKHGRNQDHPQKEDSKRMFGRLRKQLSERHAEQCREEDTSWRKNNKVQTIEEKWWDKINAAKKEKVLFDQNLAPCDLTTKTAPNSKSINDKPKTGKLDVSTITSPEKIQGTKIAGNSTNNPPSNNMNSNQDDEKKKVLSPKKKKKNIETPDSDLCEGSKGISSEKKKKKKSDKKESEAGGALSTVTDFQEKKSPKPKDKKKKKKEVDDKDEKNSSSKKKKDKNSKEESKNGRILDIVDETDLKSLDAKSHKSKKKKNNKDSMGNNNSVEMSPMKKKKNKSSSVNSSLDKDTASLKTPRAKKKKAKSSLGSSSDDAIHGDDSSVDWTNRCIVPSPSEETGTGTVITMESALR